MKKTRMQKTLERLGWTVTVTKTKVKAVWGAVKIEATTISDLRTYSRTIMAMFKSDCRKEKEIEKGIRQDLRMIAR